MKHVIRVDRTLFSTRHGIIFSLREPLTMSQRFILCSVNRKNSLLKRMSRGKAHEIKQGRGYCNKSNGQIRPCYPIGYQTRESIYGATATQVHSKRKPTYIFPAQRRSPREKLNVAFQFPPYLVLNTKTSKLVGSLLVPDLPQFY